MTSFLLVCLHDFLSGDPAKGRTWKSAVKSAFFIAVISNLWAQVWMLFMSILLPISGSPRSHLGYEEILSLAWLVCVKAPIIEEILFRLGPFIICSNFISVLRIKAELRRRTSDWLKDREMRRLLEHGLIYSIILFGVIHGSIFNIFLQGFVGFAFWMQFLYFSRIGKDKFKGVVAAMMTHAFYNLIWLLTVLFNQALK